MCVSHGTWKYQTCYTKCLPGHASDVASCIVFVSCSSAKAQSAVFSPCLTCVSKRDMLIEHTKRRPDGWQMRFQTEGRTKQHIFSTEGKGMRGCLASPAILTRDVTEIEKNSTMGCNNEHAQAAFYTPKKNNWHTHTHTQQAQNHQTLNRVVLRKVKACMNFTTAFILFWSSQAGWLAV